MRHLRLSALRLLSACGFLVLWWVLAAAAADRSLPGPAAVLAALQGEFAAGVLLPALFATLARVAAAFTLAMALGSALGYAMGRNGIADATLDPWVLLLLNIPALVKIGRAHV